MTPNEAVALLEHKLRAAEEEAAELPKPYTRQPVVWLSQVETSDVIECIHKLEPNIRK